MLDTKINSLDKKILLKFVTGLTDKDLFLCDNNPPLNLKQRLQLLLLHKKRAKGIPVSYLTKSKEFYGREFFVSPSVLIPRPETEQIIDILKGYATNNPVKSILDLCSGSGCIGITASLELQKSKPQTTLVDISNKAIKVAKHNQQKLAPNQNITILKSDLFSNIKDNQFDVILTNPPYIPNNDPDVDINTQKYEPSLALYSGQDGLDLYRKIFHQLKTKPINFQLLIGEFGFGQKKQLEIELRQNFKGCKIEFYNDLQGIPRIFTLLAK